MDEKTENAIASGWESEGYGTDLTTNLMEVRLGIMNNTYCNSMHSRGGLTINGLNGTSMVCAGSFTKQKDTCGGDSGETLI